jgi:hypothetical protein
MRKKLKTKKISKKDITKIALVLVGTCIPRPRQRQVEGL